MVRIRQQNGETVDVDETVAVEILGLDKCLAAVIVQDRGGAIHVVFPGEPLFTAYSRAYATPAARVHRHDTPETGVAKLARSG